MAQLQSESYSKNTLRSVFRNIIQLNIYIYFLNNSGLFALILFEGNATLASLFFFFLIQQDYNKLVENL